MADLNEFSFSDDVKKLNPALSCTDKSYDSKALWPAESEKDFASWFEGYLHRKGYKFAHFRAARVMRNGVEKWETPVSGDAKGLPDYHVWHWNGYYFWAELKSEKGKLSKAQFDCIDSLRRAGETVYIWHPSERAEIMRVLE